MVEFGAKLSLKDKMYSTLQKNLKMQKQFTEQVKKTNAQVTKLGRTKVNPVIKAKDLASKVIDKVKSGLKTVGSMTAKVAVAIKDGATAGLNKIKNILGTLAKGVTIGLKIAGAGVTALLGGSLIEGASLQQSVGGVETLFKGDAGMVTANADKAFKTAGLSANEYMEQVTSFSASLLQSLGGDTAKSAKVADMAIVDMADNANKMGTSMDLIQNAYQGFAKQNYTMLDNLKLGYGGTQEEMQRLLKDASKISGVKYDMSNLADVYNAIHVIQDNLGITGTTAKEASETFSGSFASMKASAKNLFANLALGGDITGSVEDLINSATTFLVNNALPMLGNVFKALPKAIKTAVSMVAPQLKETGGAIFTSIKDGIMGILPASMQGVAGSIFDGISNIFSNLPTIFEKVKTIFSNFVTATEPIRATWMTIFQQVAEKIRTVVEVVQSHMGTFKKIFDAVIPAVQTVLTTAWSVISPIIDLAITVFDELMKCVDVAFPTIQKVIEGVWNVIEGIIGGIADGINTVKDAISGIGEKIGNGINTIGSWFGFAYGKDRVPYDNYPAMLHAGERVLTRNQADQYDRVMSTRGVTVSTSITPVPTGGGNSTGGGTTVHIDKLADTVVIEKEADVDKVVEDMVTKFSKLVPNMP